MEVAWYCELFKAIFFAIDIGFGDWFDRLHGSPMYWVAVVSYRQVHPDVGYPPCRSDPDRLPSLNI